MSPIKNGQKNIIYIPLENVDSEHCALIVNKGLDTVKEIQSHTIELNNNRVKIHAEDTASVIPLVVKEIRNLGYDVPTIKKTYPIMNLSCASCANSSQNVLKQQTGVVSASVNYANASANVEYIPSLITPEELKKSLQEIGYDLMIDESDESKNSLNDIQREHFITLKRKTWGAALLSIPLVLIGMIPFFMHQTWANYLMWLLATPVVFIFGKQFFIGAYKQAIHHSANMDTLVAVSTGIAYIFSVFNTLFPSFWLNRGLKPHVYFEASAVIITFILIGKVLEQTAKGNTSSAIKKLIGLQPKTVTIIHHEKHEMEIPIKNIQKNMIVLVKPGEKIAVDGEVLTGNSFVDESMINGEPIPVEKSKGNKVFAGTINQKGSFQFKAEKVGSDTLLSQIIKTVQDAQGSKAPVQKLVDKIAGIFVPIVFSIAFLTLLIWIILGGNQGFIFGIQCFVTVLVIACPCALGLATPTAIMVGVGKGAQEGILIKDAESLETAKKTNTIILDKTGTITEGKPTVDSIEWFTETNQSLTDILYSIEKSSEHPLAEAIVNSIRDKAKFLPTIQIENITGKGIVGNFNNQKFYIGNPSFINEKNIYITESIQSYISSKLSLAKTVLVFTNESQVLSVISISDAIKVSTKEAIKQIKNLGIEIYMLTGDNHETAKLVAEKVGITHFKSEVSPQEKIDFVKQLQNSSKNKNIIAMIGDGINDSAALAQADVSIAMGKGSDIAIDVAKMTIISGDLLKVPQAIRLSKQTVATIKQNLFWAFIYNIIGIPIAAGVLYSVNGFLLNPMLASAAMALSSVSVVCNSILLKFKK